MMAAPYNVLEVSRYAIEYSNKKNYGISNLKLQKILYFIQAYFLVEASKKCFKEKIEAWNFGPVVPEVYREYKRFGGTNIPTMTSKLEFYNMWDVKRVPYGEITISDEDKKLIDDVIDHFSEYSATDLVKLTHHQAPWKNAYSPYENNEITTESIEEYFSE